MSAMGEMVLEIMELISAGLTDEEISSALGVPESWVHEQRAMGE
jgi:DNA-binding NarL/FixJ family response regulator